MANLTRRGGGGFRSMAASLSRAEVALGTGIIAAVGLYYGQARRTLSPLQLQTMAKAAAEEGDYVTSNKLYSEAITVVTMVGGSKKTKQDRRDSERALYVLHMSQGDVQARMGDTSKALDSFDAAMAQLKDSATSDQRIMRASGLDRQAQLLQGRHQFRKAEAKYFEALDELATPMDISMVLSVAAPSSAASSSAFAEDLAPGRPTEATPSQAVDPTDPPRVPQAEAGLDSDLGAAQRVAKDLQRRGVVESIAGLMHNLGTLFVEEGKVPAAAAVFQRGLHICSLEAATERRRSCMSRMEERLTELGGGARQLQGQQQQQHPNRHSVEDS